MIKTIQIPKKNGQFRTVYAPDRAMKIEQQSWLPMLHSLCDQLDTHQVQHGFMKDRSPLTNAMQHIGFAYTLSMDFKDFFDSVTQEKVVAAVPIGSFDNLSWFQLHNSILYHDGVAVQGFCTSPLLANIAASPVDAKIMEFLDDCCNQTGRFGRHRFAYTRYADDMCVSCDNLNIINRVKDEIPIMAARFGFTINENKTRIQAASAGNRIITGYSVGRTKVDLTHKFKRRLRACEHQERHGLKERNASRLAARQKHLRRTIPILALFWLTAKGMHLFAAMKKPAKYEPPKSQSTAKKALNRVTEIVKVTSAGTTHAIARLFGRKF